jgi:hypothetical protein
MEVRVDFEGARNLKEVSFANYDVWEWMEITLSVRGGYSADAPGPAVALLRAR